MDTKAIDAVKDLGTGWVRVSCGKQWAQLPAQLWDEIICGELVPPQYCFEPEWGRLRKPYPEEILGRVLVTPGAFNPPEKRI